MQNQETVIETDVMISGAGPTGLTLASLLARWDVSFCLLEKKPDLSKESKAFNLHARSLEIFSQLGVVEKALQEGDTDIRVHLLKKAEIAANLDLRVFLLDETAYPHLLIIPQYKTEQLLHNSLKSRGKQVLWEHELKELREISNGVEATVTRPNGKVEKIRAQYVVGCDGAGSTVRKQTGFTYEGKTYSPTFYLADAEVEWKYTHGDVYFSLAKDHLTAFFPFQKENKYRIFNFMNPAFEKDEDEDLTLEEVQMMVDSNPYHEILVKNPEWLSVFKIHSRLPDTFSKGRIFLAGDAASVHSPVGGQGMNTGIQDSYNLAWKLALVLKSKAAPQLLDSYNEERYRIARNLHQSTDRLFSIITKQNQAAGFFRTWIFPYIFRFMISFWPIREKSLRRFSQIAVKYRFSSLNIDEKTGGLKWKAPMTGDRAPYSKLTIDNQKTDTHCLLNCDRFTVFIIVSDPEDYRIDQLQKKLKKFSTIPMNIHVLSGKNGGTELYKRYGVKKNALFIIRPDGHIGFRTSVLNESGPETYFRHILQSDA